MSTQAQQTIACRLAGVANDSIVDGPGLRMAVFLQGCPHKCPGCHNPHTHDPAGGYEADTAALCAKMDSNPLLQGLTLTGGEPFCQPQAALALARHAKARGLNVWAYTGSTYEELMAGDSEAVRALLAVVDVLVDGPFLQAQKSLELRFRGSSNQRLIDMQKTRQNEQVALWQPPVW